LTDALLLFLGRAGGFERWLRLEGGAVAGRGRGDSLPPPPSGTTVAAIVPGDSVALHRLDLPAGLAPAQAAAAARLAAVDHSAQPVSDLHVAVGAAGEGLRCVAIASSACMTDWLERCLAAGFDPDLILPETLLLPAPEEGFVRCDRGTLSLYRSASDAFAIEPDLAAPLLAGSAVRDLDSDSFEQGLAAAVGNPPVNLRQGAFARRRDLKLDRKLIRRLALLAAAILLVTLAIQFVSILRYTFAADALEREADRVAAVALPRNPGIRDAPADLGRRLGELRGGGLGFVATAAPVFAAIRDTANAELASLAFTPDGTLRANVQADNPATLSALARRIEASGFSVETGPPRGGGGRQVAELIVRPR
jgi:general secretion pathway protein L